MRREYKCKNRLKVVPKVNKKGHFNEFSKGQKKKKIKENIILALISFILSGLFCYLYLTFI